MRYVLRESLGRASGLQQVNTVSNLVPVLDLRPLSEAQGTLKPAGICLEPLWWVGISGSPQGGASRVHQAEAGYDLACGGRS